MRPGSSARTSRSSPSSQDQRAARNGPVATRARRQDQRSQKRDDGPRGGEGGQGRCEPPVRERLSWRPGSTSGDQLNQAAKNPELLFYKLKTNAYKFSWALIPISVPFVWLLFPFSRRFKLYDHTVFVTYSLCFMMLLLAASSADRRGFGSARQHRLVRSARSTCTGSFAAPTAQQARRDLARRAAHHLRIHRDFAVRKPARDVGAFE